VNSQSIIKFAGLFAHYDDVAIDIGYCGPGGGAAGREDILREGRAIP